MTDASTRDAAEPAGHEEKERPSLWAELRSVLFILLAVLFVHSFVAKPFYIPSESMMPGLLKGDRLLVTKYPYGWSYISPSFHLLPFMKGRVFGRLPERGDVVIAVPIGRDVDYIKRVIGLPGDTIAVRGGRVILNGRMLPRDNPHTLTLPVDANSPCSPSVYPDARVTLPDGTQQCRLTVVDETIPSRDGPVRFPIIDDQTTIGDEYGPITIPAGHVFLMGDNRDRSADSRFPVEDEGLGGPIPWENLGGRAEFITFSMDGTATWYNPLSWFEAARGDRALIGLHPEPAFPQSGLSPSNRDPAPGR